jgi:hypothetical protein
MNLRQQILLNHALSEDASNVTNPIWQELVKEIADSTCVQIFSAFYGLNFLLNLFDDEAVAGRRSRELFLMFGRKSAPGLEEQLNDLTKFKADLIERGYLCRPMDGFAVPDFWEDQQSSEDFITSFCEYLFSKLTVDGRTPAIVNHLADNFNLRGAKDEFEIEELISSRLQKHGWMSDDWPEFPENILAGE